MELLKGKELANTIKEEIRKEVEEIKKHNGKTPHLAAVLVGKDGASETYVNHKEKACKQIGFNSTVLRFDENITEKQLLSEVDKLNKNTDVDGFIVQLPLPEHIDDQKIINSIDPTKDVDGFHPENIGRLCLGMPGFISATPFGIMELIKRHEIQTEGKHIVVLGRSNIVGRPISILLGQKKYPGNATITLCHSRTKNISEITKQADIIIVALGKKEYLKANMVKDGVVVIDVGISRVKSDKTKSGWKLIGDVDFDDVSKKSSYITPVPGGVGPMTIVGLLKNTLEASKTK